MMQVMIVYGIGIKRLRARVLKVRLLFAWYDMWIGAYIDRKNRRLYVLPLPTLGFVVEW